MERRALSDYGSHATREEIKPVRYLTGGERGELRQTSGYTGQSLYEVIKSRNNVNTCAVIAAGSFPNFPQLPAELRPAIWRQAFENCYVPRCIRREGPQRLLGLLQMMQLPLNLMSEVLDHDDRGGPYDEPRKRWNGIGLGDEMNVVHFTFKSGIPCLLHACRQSRLVVLEEWKSLVLLTADAWEDRDHCQPWIHEGASLYERHLKVVDLEIGRTKRVGDNASTD